MAENKKAVLHTTEGDITVELFGDMPVTVGNIEKLISEKFYDGIVVHRVIKDFMVQIGCPKGDGTGGPGYTIKDEFVKGHSNLRGSLAMANTGRPNTGGSQFFINLVDNTYLDWDNTSTPSKHPVFGRVADGMKVVDLIGNAKTDRSDRPRKEVKIISAEML